MTFKLGPLPEVPEFTPDDNWTVLQEPSMWGFQLRAIPIAIITTGVFALLWMLLTPVRYSLGTLTFPPPILRNAVTIVGVIVVHELIHASLHPQFGLSKETVIGFFASKMFVYTIFTGALTKTRCLIILIMPFVVISILPLLYAAVTQTASLLLGYISVLNALLGSGDLLAASMTARLIPGGSMIRSKGWTSFYKRGG